MRRKTVALLLCMLIAVTGCVGCGQKEQNITVTEIVTTPDVVETTKPAPEMQVVTVWSDSAHEQTIREVQIEEFNNTIGKEEGIQIDYSVFGPEYTDEIDAALSSGTGPDLFRPSSNTFAGYVSRGYAVPISDLDGSNSLLSKYDRGDLIVGDQIFNGEVYTLPYSLQTYKMIINKDLFDAAGISEVPKTWDEVREDAKIITESTNGESYGYFLSLQSGWTMDHYIYSVASPCIGHFGYDAVSGRYRYADGLPIVENILGMIKDGSVLPGYEEMDADQARAQFSAGHVGIVMAASFDVAVYTEQFPATCNWIVCEPPAIEEGSYPYKEMVTALDLLGVSKKALTAKDTAKVAKVLEWFYADENLVEMYEKGMYIPYRSEVLSKAQDSTAHGWKEFSTFLDDQFIIRMADPKGVIAYEDLSPRDTLAKLLAGGYKEDAKTVLEDLDRRLNEGLDQLDTGTMASYKAPSSYMINRE